MPGTDRTHPDPAIADGSGGTDYAEGVDHVASMFIEGDGVNLDLPLELGGPLRTLQISAWIHGPFRGKVLESASVRLRMGLDVGRASRRWDRAALGEREPVAARPRADLGSLGTATD